MVPLETDQNTLKKIASDLSSYLTPLVKNLKTEEEKYSKYLDSNSDSAYNRVRVE